MAGGTPRAGATRNASDLNERQRRFVAEYLIDLNATQAAIRAGYSAKTANRIGPRLLSHVGVAAAVRAGKTKQAKRLEITADRVLQELARVAFADIGAAFDESGALLPVHQIPEDTRRALSSVESDELMGGTGDERGAVGMTRKVKLADKLRGLEMLGKHLKLFDGAPQTPTSAITFIVRGAEDEDAGGRETAGDRGPAGLPANTDAGTTSSES